MVCMREPVAAASRGSCSPFDQMKVFYTLVLLSGFCLFVMTEWAGYHMPKEFVVALALSRSPDGWSVSMNDAGQNSLSRYDVKRELTAALHKRTVLGTQIRAYTVWFDLGLMVLSIVGLLRERKIDRLAKLIERDAAPNGGPVTRLGNSGVTEGPPSVS